jgi:hypothetical protein
VFNGAHALLKLKKKVSNNGKKAFVNIFRNYWRHKHLLYQVFLREFKNHLSKVYKVMFINTEFWVKPLF